MLSNKTKELFTQFLESLKEDTGFSPTSVDFWQTDCRGNTTEEKALQLEKDHGFRTVHLDTFSSSKKDTRIGHVDLGFSYHYKPEEAEEEEGLVTCEQCENEFEPLDMCDEGDLCLKCNMKAIEEGEKEQRQLEKEYNNSRL